MSHTSVNDKNGVVVPVWYNQVGTVGFTIAEIESVKELKVKVVEGNQRKL